MQNSKTESNELIQFSPVLEIVNDLKQGKMIILVDNEFRENEGDLVLSAEFVTPEFITFMARNACGLICLALSKDQVERLKLPPMVPEHLNQSSNKTAFTVSIEASQNVTTGISSSDRARTMKIASDPKSRPSDLKMPGHVFPLCAHPKGLAARAGHTEASIELMKLAQLNPAAVLCEIINEKGEAASFSDLKKFSDIHGIKIGSVDQLQEFLNSIATGKG